LQPWNEAQADIRRRNRCADDEQARGEQDSKNGGGMDLPHRRNIVNDHDPEQRERHDEYERSPFAAEVGQARQRVPISFDVFIRL